MPGQTPVRVLMVTLMRPIWIVLPIPRAQVSLLVSLGGGFRLLRYALQRGWACIPKTTKEDRLKENFDIDAFELSEDDVKALDALEANANMTWDAPPGQHFDLTALP